MKFYVPYSICKVKSKNLQILSTNKTIRFFFKWIFLFLYLSKIQFSKIPMSISSHFHYWPFPFGSYICFVFILVLIRFSTSSQTFYVNIWNDILYMIQKEKVNNENGSFCLLQSWKIRFYCDKTAKKVIPKKKK